MTCTGLPEWSAPEMIQGCSQYTNKVDMWSIGCVVYFTLFGYKPFDSCQSIGKLKRLIMEGKYDFPNDDNAPKIS